MHHLRQSLECAITLYKAFFSSAFWAATSSSQAVSDVCTDMNTQFIKYLLTTTLQGHAPSPHLDVTLLCTNIRHVPGQFLSVQTFLLLNQTISGTGTEPGQLKEVHTRSGRCRGEGDGMALLALNKLQSRQCLRLCFLGRLSKASILFLCASGSGKLELAFESTCHEFIRAEKGVGQRWGKHRCVLNTSWLMQFPAKGSTDIPQVSLGTEVLLEQLMDSTDVFTNGKTEREKQQHPSTPQKDAQ